MGRTQTDRTVRRAGAAALAVAAGLLVAGCGVEPGHAAPGLPRPDLAVPDGWRQVTVCADQGAVTAAMPAPVEFDGPRDLRNIDEPAQGTFAWGYNPDRTIRYDVYAVTDADAYGTSDREVGREVVRQLNGSPADVTIRNVEDRGDHAIGTYDEWFDDRDYRMRFVSDEGTVVALGVGIYEHSAPATIARAKRDLEVMWDSLEVAGVDGVPAGRCDGPSDEPR